MVLKNSYDLNYGSGYVETDFHLYNSLFLNVYFFQAYYKFMVDTAEYFGADKETSKTYIYESFI